MKFLIYVSSNELDGVSRYASQLAQALSIRGCQVHILFPVINHYTFHSLVTWQGGGLTIQLRKLKYALAQVAHHVALRRMRYVGSSLLTGTNVKTSCYLRVPSGASVAGYDVILLANNWYQIYEYPWDSLGNTRVVQILHHLNDAKLMHPAERDAWRTPLTRIAVSEYTKGTAVRQGVAVDAMIHCGVDLNLFSPGDGACANAGIVVTLYWGREPRKGFTLGIEACELVRQQYPEAAFYIIGGPRSMRRDPALDALAKNGYKVLRSLSDRNLVRHLRGTTVFLYPSVMEGFGLPPLEAMACGASVVTTSVGAVPEYGKHMENMWIADKTAPALAQGVSALIADPELRARIEVNAVEAARRFGWSQAAAKMISFLEAEVRSSSGSRPQLQADY